LESLRENQPDVYDDDPVRDQLDSLFEGRVGRPPASQEYLNQLYKEGEARYEQERPPGYMDIGKGKNDGAESYFYGDLIVQGQFGDFILWKQILEEAQKRERLKHLIFITDDEKEDWWAIVTSRGAKRLGPRPELSEEIAAEAGISHFYMYNSERFLTFAQRFLNISVKKTSVDQVRDVAQLSETARRTRAHQIRSEISAAEGAVFEWLTSLYPGGAVKPHQFPDFVVVDEIGTREGYEVKYVREPRILQTRLREVVYRGYYEVAEGNLSAFNLVLVSDNLDTMEQLRRQLESPRYDAPANVSIILGILESIRIPDGSMRHEFLPISRHGQDKEEFRDR